MKHFLAADLGGTKVLLQLTTEQNSLVLEQQYSSQQFTHFDDILTTFLRHDAVKHCLIDSACFAVAGSVAGREASMTNRPWHLNADQLAEQFNIQNVYLCNDFVAVAQGISSLTDNEIITLQHGEQNRSAPRAVIGAGTGLGQAVMLPELAGWRVFATEGGHTDFAPTDQLQIRLLDYMMTQFDPVSYEHLVSGAGLVNIYQFLLNDQQTIACSALRLAMSQGDAAATISQFALEQRDPTAQQALDLFVKIYGAQAGNLALTLLPKGGLYIAGGIATKNVQRFIDGPFLKGFLAKGKMTGLMHTIPVHLIMQPKVGLLGAGLLARQSLTIAR